MSIVVVTEEGGLVGNHTCSPAPCRLQRNEGHVRLEVLLAPPAGRRGLKQKVRVRTAGEVGRAVSISWVDVLRAGRGHLQVDHLPGVLQGRHGVFVQDVLQRVVVHLPGQRSGECRTLWTNTMNIQILLFLQPVFCPRSGAVHRGAPLRPR